MASEGPQPQAEGEADQKQSLMGTHPSAGTNVTPPVLSGADPGPDCVPGDSPFAAATRPDTAAEAAQEQHQQQQQQGQGSGDPGGTPSERDSLLCTPLGGSNMSYPFGRSSHYERMLSYESYGGDLPFSPIMRHKQQHHNHEQQNQQEQQYQEQQQQKQEEQQQQQQQQQRGPPRPTGEEQVKVKREASETPGGDGGLSSRDVDTCLEANTQDTDTKGMQAEAEAAARAGAAEPPAGPSPDAAAPLRTAVVTTGAPLPTASAPAPNAAQTQSTFNAVTTNPIGVPVTTGGPAAPPQQHPAAAAAASTPSASTAAAVDNQSLLVGLFRTLAAAREHVAVYGSLPPPLAGAAAGTGVPGVGTPSDWGADVAACWRPQVVADTPPPQQQVRSATHWFIAARKAVCLQCHATHALHPLPRS